MGRTKELVINQLNAEMSYEPIREPKYYKVEQPCPNCMKQSLTTENNENIYCKSCGQEFVKVGTALRFV